MLVTVSIVSFNSSQLIRNSLNDLLKFKYQNKVQIIVVDNASSDSSVAVIKKEFPQVKLIESKKNLGFAGGHNLVLKNIKSDFYLILNPDTQMDENVIDPMVEFMNEYPDCGIASCKVLNFDGSLQPSGGDLPNFLSVFSWLFNLDVLGLSSLHRNEDSFYKRPHPVGWVSGNFMMVKKEVIVKIGPLNEEYFMYFEDIDYCFKATKNNFKVMINPAVSIKHLSGGSLDQPKFRQWTGEFKGLILFFKKQNFLVGSGIKLLVYLAATLRMVLFFIIGKFNISLTYAKVIVSLP
ncbi:MAG: glycosyltransferase family 2 protein [Candidatus Daviesbacteria bacterium]|nr:MAG: glycosyltransferase family 2 protein [Candidatus Daviesbacteria bacterium]